MTEFHFSANPNPDGVLSIAKGSFRLWALEITDVQAAKKVRYENWLTSTALFVILNPNQKIVLASPTEERAKELAADLAKRIELVRKTMKPRTMRL